MNVLVAISAVFACLTVYFLAKSLRRTRQGRLLRAGGAGIGGIGAAAIAFAAALLAMTFYSYDRLTAEQRVATVAFRQTGIDQYQARLMIENEPDRVFELHGDEWQIDARVVTWKPPMTILGLDPVYRLERINGRYTDIDRERNDTRTVYQLSTPAMIDIWNVARRFPAFTPGIDAYYGTATYVPMADGARFEVNLSRDALIARPANAAAKAAVGDWRTG